MLQPVYDVIIIGGSYAGMSAAMSLGRSLRHVVVIDSGKPCNRQTPHAHNLITHDGEAPAAIAAKAKEEVLQYSTIEWVNDTAIDVSKNGELFAVRTEKSRFIGQKLLFATGVRDIMPGIPGFEACWGISVLHCPYCHGYEIRGNEIGILASGEPAVEMVILLQHWFKKITLLTNNTPLNADELARLAGISLAIDDRPIINLQHENGQLNAVVFADGESLARTAIFARPAMEQHCPLPEMLGCTLENGFIKVDDFQATNVPGIYAAGDNTTMFRSLAIAIAAGTKAGAVINKDLTISDLQKTTAMQD